MHSSSTYLIIDSLAFSLKNGKQAEPPDNRILDPFNLVHPDGHHPNEGDKPKQ